MEPVWDRDDYKIRRKSFAFWISKVTDFFVFVYIIYDNI